MKDGAATVEKLKLKCFFRRAIAYKMQGKFAKALGDVDKIIAIEPASARALALREELVLAQLSGSDGAPAAAPAATLAATPAAAPAAAPTTIHARCLACKLQGNAALKAKKLADAVAAYSAGIDALVSARREWEEDVEARHLLVTLHSNRAQAHLERKAWRDAAADCAAALDVGVFEGKTAALGFKLQFRRAKAHRLWAADVAKGGASGASEASALLRRAGADIRAIIAESKRVGNVLSPSAVRGAQLEGDALKTARSALAAAAATAAAATAPRGHGACSFMYRYILRESCSQFDSLPLTSLTISPSPFPAPRGAAAIEEVATPTKGTASSPAAGQRKSPAAASPQPSPASAAATLRARESARERARERAVASVPKTAYDFERTWAALALATDAPEAASDATLAARYEYMQRDCLKPAKLKKLFARGLEPALFAEIIALFARVYAAKKPKRTLGHLKAMHHLSSFGTSLLMMGSAEDAATLKDLFATLRAALGADAVAKTQLAYGI